MSVSQYTAFYKSTGIEYQEERQHTDSTQQCRTRAIQKNLELKWTSLGLYVANLPEYVRMTQPSIWLRILKKIPSNLTDLEQFWISGPRYAKLMKTYPRPLAELTQGRGEYLLHTTNTHLLFCLINLCGTSVRHIVWLCHCWNTCKYKMLFF